MGWIWKVMGREALKQATDQEWSSPPGENDTRINQSVSQSAGGHSTSQPASGGGLEEDGEVPLLVGPRSGHGTADADCGEVRDGASCACRRLT